MAVLRAVRTQKPAISGGHSDNPNVYLKLEASAAKLKFIGATGNTRLRHSCF